MTNPSISQSQKRFQESIAPLFSETNLAAKKKCLFLKSSSDIGVIRNSGRNGARFAPQSLLATFKKFANNEKLNHFQFVEVEVSNPEEEKINFHDAQLSEARRITKLLEDHPNSHIFHLGGGHDHIYPLLVALSKNYKKVIVINIDAHADTRTDEKHHSGTPFRRFAQDYSGEFKIYQLGLHPFANTTSTLLPLNKGEVHVLWKNELNSEKLKMLFQEIEKDLTPNTLAVFSLDADALNGSEVPGVSAVNPSGLTQSEILEIKEYYLNLELAHPPVIGVYELNPLYDTLASMSMRTIGSFIYSSFNR